MILFKRLNMMNWLKKVNTIQNTETSDFVEKADYDTKNGEIEEKLLIVIMINILLLNNLIS